MPAREGLKSIDNLKTLVKKLKMSINECLKPNNGCLMPAREGLKSAVELKTSVKKLKMPTD